jgi:hypothetical protein
MAFTRSGVRSPLAPPEKRLLRQPLIVSGAAMKALFHGQLFYESPFIEEHGTSYGQIRAQFYWWRRRKRLRPASTAACEPTARVRPRSASRCRGGPPSPRSTRRHGAITGSFTASYARKQFSRRRSKVSKQRLDRACPRRESSRCALADDPVDSVDALTVSAMLGVGT